MLNKVLPDDGLGDLFDQNLEEQSELFGLTPYPDGTRRGFDFNSAKEIICNPKSGDLSLKQYRLGIYQSDYSSEFYRSCPGIIGAIVREVTDLSPQTPASFVFAAAAATVGALRGAYVRGKFKRLQGTNLNFFCLAKTGRGKELPRSTMSEALVRSKLFGVRSIKTDDFRSKQGLYEAIDAAGGIQIILHDEANQFFTQIKGDSTAYHLKDIKPLLLKLFSAWSRANMDAGRTANQMAQPLVYPSVSYCGFGTPESIGQVFAKEDFSDGWLSRFIILMEDPPLISEEECQDVTALNFVESAEWQDMIRSVKQGQEWRKLYAEEPAKIPFHEVEASREALKIYYDFDRQIIATRNNLGGAVDIYARAKELIGRVATVISDDTEITADAVTWAIIFVKKGLANINAVLNNHRPNDWFEKSERVAASIGATPMTHRDVQRANRFLKSKAEALEILSDLVAEGKILEVPGKTTNGRRATFYKKANKNE